MESLVAVAVVAALALLVLVVIARTVRIVPQARAGIVERLGRYQRTLAPADELHAPPCRELLLTDAVQGVALGHSAMELIGQHKKLSESSAKADANGLVAGADLRGWKMLLDTDPTNPGAVSAFSNANFWSRPVRMR